MQKKAGIITHYDAKIRRALDNMECQNKEVKL